MTLSITSDSVNPLYIPVATLLLTFTTSILPQNLQLVSDVTLEASLGGIAVPARANRAIPAPPTSYPIDDDVVGEFRLKLR